MRLNRSMSGGRVRWITGLGVLALLIQAWVGHGAAKGQKISKAKAVEGDEVFTTTNVPHLRIEIPAKGMERLRGRGWSWGWGGATRERPEVEVTVMEGGHTYTNVGLHLKGSAGSFQPIESKPGLTLTFDKFVKGQTFHGLQKISLNNSVQDPSFLTEKVCRELFNAAGVPAPRADYASVELNGRKLGLYVLLEGYNRQFLKRHFQNTRGTLYDGGFLKDIDSPLATNAGQNPRDESDLKGLVAAANEPDTKVRFGRLEKVLDMDRFITFMAMEVMVCHWDGYCMNKNNFRVYHDLDSNRIMFMPHGMDQMFGVMMVQATMSVRPQFQGLVAKAVMETPEGRRRYYARLADLNRTLFNVEHITNEIYQATARIRPVLALLSPSAVSSHEAAITDLCDRIVQRKQSLDEQFAGGGGQLLEFDSAGLARLTSWAGQTNTGKPVLAQETGPSGKPVLHIRAIGSSIGSWRTKVLLEEGHYVFQGRMQLHDVVTDPADLRAGAGLRAGRQPSLQKSRGELNWKEVTYEFDVPEGLREVELVCELRAAKGDAWFELDSLRLMRK